MSSNRKSSPLYISRIRSASGGGGATGGVEAILISTPCLSGLLGVGLIRLTTAAARRATDAAAASPASCAALSAALAAARFQRRSCRAAACWAITSARRLAAASCRAAACLRTAFISLRNSRIEQQD